MFRHFLYFPCRHILVGGNTLRSSSTRLPPNPSSHVSELSSRLLTTLTPSVQVSWTSNAYTSREWQTEDVSTAVVVRVVFLYVWFLFFFLCQLRLSFVIGVSNWTSRLSAIVGGPAGITYRVIYPFICYDPLPCCNRALWVLKQIEPILHATFRHIFTFLVACREFYLTLVAAGHQAAACPKAGTPTW